MKHLSKSLKQIVMTSLWKLVFIAIISAGLTDGSDQEDITDQNKEESRQETFLTSSDIISAAKFQCQNKPSGYYADPRFDCKVFHFCHEDGTRLTIPCILESEKHNICIFRDITFNACEGSEIYLALPEDLHVKSPKDTTASAISSATDFKLSNVLPFPNSPSENNQSTTPLSLEFKQTSKSNSLIDSKEYGSIFEVFNSVLREIQAEKIHKIPSGSPNKRSPSTFSRGSKFQASSIRRDDSSDDLQSENQRSKNQDAFLVEVYKGNEKLLDNHNPYKKSKKLFFLPKTQKETPGTLPRRKKRTVAEPLTVSRPYAVIYAKVPNTAKSSNSEVPRKYPSQRKDIIEVPFVAARVPSDVPAVPITIETRRKKKSKSKKKAKQNSQIFYIEETSPEENSPEQTSEQRNVLFYSSEQVPGIGLQGIYDRSVIDDRYQSKQNSDQAQHVPEQINNEAQAATQNNFQANHQTQLSSQNANNVQLPSFPFQPPPYMSNSAPQQFYFGSQNLHQPGNFPSFGLPDPFGLQPQEVQHQPFRQPEVTQTQSIRQQGNNHPQTVKQPEDIVQTVNQPRNNQQVLGPPESVWTQNIRLPENIAIQAANQQVNTPQSPPGQPESRHRQTVKPENIQSQSSRIPESSSQSFRQAENNRPKIFRQPDTNQIQTYSQPEIAQTQMFRQPETVQTQAYRQQENIQPQTLRHAERVQPHRIRQPEIIQPQTIRQLQDIQLQNISPLPFGQQEGVFHQPIRATQLSEPNLENTNTRNTPNNNQNSRLRNIGAQQQGVPESVISQRFPGFDSPFFQNFPSFGSLHFNGPFVQPSPPTYNLLPPPGTQFQEQQNPQQHVSNQENVHELAPQQLEKPQDQTISQYPTLNRPQNLNQQQYSSHVRQQTPENGAQSGVMYLQQPNQNPNLIQSERGKQERPNLGNENSGAQVLGEILQPARPPRNRGRSTSVAESPERQQERQRNRGQGQRQIFRSPQEDRAHEKPRHESQQHSNQSPRRPTEQQYNSPEVAYRPQRPPESDNQNENHYLHPSPSADTVPNFNPQNIREDGRQVVQSQRQPSRQRNRQYYNDNSNRQAIPQYSPTTPVPSLPPRQILRQPEQYRPREIYQVSRPSAENTASSPENDRPYYGYRTSDSPYEKPRVSPTPQERPKTTAVLYETPRTSAYPYERPRTSSSPYERPVTSAPHHEIPRTYSPSYENTRTRTSPVQHQTQGVPVTHRYFVTSRPRFKASENENIRYNQDEQPEVHYERPRTRPQAQIERPPPEYVNAETLSEEKVRPQRYNSHRQQHNSNLDNDVNIVSTIEDSDHRPRTPTRSPRQRYREQSSEGQKYSPEIEHGFLPVSERPHREYSRATVAPGRHYREPEKERVRVSERPNREYSRATSAPEKHYREPVNERFRASERPQKEYSRTTPAPKRHREPENERARVSENPYREYSRATTAPERYYREPENERVLVSERPYREYSRPTAAPERNYREPENERVYASERPNREYSRATQTPERNYREPENEGGRGKSHYSYDEEIPTTRLVTTPKPTQKRKPPPPRPTFPAFPTFPPPPRRIVTSPHSVATEKPEKEEPNTISYSTSEEPRTTQETSQRNSYKIDDISEVENSRDSVTGNYIQTEAPETTTKRRPRKRRPKPRRPKTTTPYSNDDEDVVHGDTITQATTRREVTTRSTPSNYNRWRQQTSPQRKTTSSPSTEAPSTENSGRTEEYGSRINLFGRPRTRKPAFLPRSATTTQTAPLLQERQRSSKVPTATRTRKPFTKKLRKKTTTETPYTTEQIARNDENGEFFNLNSYVNSLQGLESVTQLSVENAEETFTTEPYNDVVQTTTLNSQDESSLNSTDKGEDFESTRSLTEKFQNKPRILKFRKPRLRTSDSTDLNTAESKIYR